jgi:16S rRNA (uracil1498-N3)-methyltransferase
MTRRRWIADETSGNRAALVGEHARHLAQVLRAHIGQEFEISVEGHVRSARIAAVSPERVEFELGEAVSTFRDFPITVAISVFKFDRMEWAIEKCRSLRREPRPGWPRQLASESTDGDASHTKPLSNRGGFCYP